MDLPAWAVTPCVIVFRRPLLVLPEIFRAYLVQMMRTYFYFKSCGALTAFLVEPSWRPSAWLSLTAQEVAATKSQEIEKTQGANGFLAAAAAFFFLFVGIIGAIFWECAVFFLLNSIAMGCLLVTFAWGALWQSATGFCHTFLF